MSTPLAPSPRLIAPSPSFSPPPPSSTPLFFSPNPRPKPTESPVPPSSTTSTPTPRRRTPLSAAGASAVGGKRSPAATRAWSRRLSFSSGSNSPAASGTTTPQQGSVFDFNSLSPPARKDPFDLSVMGMAMDVDGMQGSLAPVGTAEKRVRRLPSGWQRRKSGKTRINDLPDEILLRIFGFLNDTLGFRPLSSRVSVTPEWYNPPLKIALVCQRWLPLARHLFYRFLKISHLSRIPLLHRTFTTTDLPLLVRHLSIDLPPSAVDQLGVPWPAAAVPAAREADSDLDSLASGRTTPVEHAMDDSGYPLTPSSSRKKPRKPLLLQDQLRAVFQSCSELLSLEISGVPPALLFTSSYSAAPSPSHTSPSSPSAPSLPSPSALHHLHLLRLSTVTSLTLRARPSYTLSSASSPLLEGHITPTTLRDALLALTGLTALTLKGYVSSSASTDALDFAPTRTPLGLLARPLPSRARARALLPLRSLALLDCALSPSDLLTLLKQVRPGSLRSLTVEEAFDPALAGRRGREGLWARPTVEGLNGRGVKELVQGSLEALRVTLYNYPVVVGGAAVTAGPVPALSPPRPAGRRRTRTVPLPGSADLDSDAPPPGEAHLLDCFISSLSSLTSLDLGGLVVTPSLFSPPAPPPPPGSPSAALPPLPSVPGSVERLTLRSCPGITPGVIQLFLSPPSSSSFSPSSSASAASASTAPAPAASPSLRSLTVHASTEYGWADPTLCWAVQRACWARGVRWNSGSGSGGGGGGGGRTGGGGAGVSWTGVAPSAAAASASTPMPTTASALSGGSFIASGQSGSERGGDGVAASASTSGGRGGSEGASTATTTMLEAPQQWVGQGQRLGRAQGRW
ncbi:hypothetical protein JCM6882_007175 [Rhodosporidiobolus microsporus]